jgi:hypothetical protein
LSGDREELIRAEAYRRWLEEGRPEGQHERHWREAAEAIDETTQPGMVETVAAPQAMKKPRTKAQTNAPAAEAEVAKAKRSRAARDMA